MISRTRCGGERSSTLWIVRSKAFHASLWNIIITLVSGSLSAYFSCRHLRKNQLPYGKVTLCLFRSYALSRHSQLHQNFPQIPIQTKELGTSLSFICLYMSYLYVFPSFALSHYEAKYQIVRTNTNIIPVFVLWSTLVSCIENLSVCLITFLATVYCYK